MTPLTRIRRHIHAHGLSPVRGQLRSDLQILVWRYEITIRQGHHVELSPYLKVLLGLAQDEAASARAAAMLQRGA